MMAIVQTVTYDEKKRLIQVFREEQGIFCAFGCTGM